ncbi:MAG: 30S ribosomal protein S2 [Candidatus Pacebacteria bacterium]|nr:30S ribosomal protein S2 [Candidatus Paceibacterota bacterium]
MVDKKKDPKIEELLQVGAHFGYASQRRHPSVAKYILGSKNKVEIFDLEKTVLELEEVKKVIAEAAEKKKRILFASSKGEAREIIRKAAESIDMPYVAGRWIGGTITNFDQIKKQVEKLVTLSEQKEKGELGKYTKKERLMIDRDIERLQEMFSGIVGMNKTPDLLFVVDPKQEKTAVSEAVQKGIPVIALSNSDCDISIIDYPIPANDSARASIEYILKDLVSAYKN